jgi:hypothetical protein
MKGWMQAMGVAAVLGLSAGAAPLAAQGGAQMPVKSGAAAPSSDEAPAGALVATEEPPAPQEEQMGTAPSPAHVWVSGYWHWRGRRWLWMRGSWARPPRGFHAWMPGHWARYRRGWYWVPGHWRR